MIRIERHSHGRRLYVAGRRWHHFWTGAILTGLALAVKRRKLALAAAIYAASDVRDFPWRDCDNH
jgi:hypothetical protein